MKIIIFPIGLSGLMEVLVGSKAIQQYLADLPRTRLPHQLPVFAVKINTPADWDQYLDFLQQVYPTSYPADTTPDKNTVVFSSFIYNSAFPPHDVSLSRWEHKIFPSAKTLPLLKLFQH